MFLQAVFKQFGGGVYGNSDSVFADSAEYRQHQKLEKLYISTRAAKVGKGLLCHLALIHFLLFI